MANKIWFVTGISRGLGKSIASYILSRGDVVVGTTRSGKSDLPTNSRLHVVKLDVSDRDAVGQAVRAAAEKHGRLDVVLNNAGYGLLGAIEEATPAEVEQIFAVNYFGALNVIQAALPILRKQRSGHIISIASIAGIAPGAGSGIYASAKFALVGLSEVLAQELAPLGVKVTAVEPGVFRTEFFGDRSLVKSERQFDEYDSTAGKTIRTLESLDGKQPGDPDRAAIAIGKLVDSTDPPVNLLLGSDALKRTRSMLEQYTSSVDAWESVTRSTDFES